MAIKNYRELLVWQRAMEFVEMVYEMTGSFPPHERYGLTSQIQRAAVSVPANIAEGYGAYIAATTCVTCRLPGARFVRQKRICCWRFA